MINFDAPLSRSELARRLGVHRSTLWNFEKRGLLPSPNRVSGKRSEFSPAAQMLAADLVVSARA